jgi:hypothetical protein
MIMMPYGGPGPSPQLTAQADFWHPTHSPRTRWRSAPLWTVILPGHDSLLSKGWPGNRMPTSSRDYIRRPR